MAIQKFLRFLLLLTIMGGFCVMGSTVFAEDGAKKQPPAFTWTFYSNYIWQGLELNKVPSSNFNLQKPGVSFSPLQSFDAGFNSFKKDGKRPQGLLSYQNSFSLTDETALNWKLGWLTYETEAGENEKTFAGVGLNTFLSPEVSLWKGKEFNQDSWTVNLGVSQNWRLNNSAASAEGWTFGLGSGLSYSSFDRSGYDDTQNANVWAGLNIPFADGASLSPSVNYSFPVKEGKRAVSGEGDFRGLDSSFIFGGVDLKVPF